MLEYDAAKIQELFKRHGITDFEVEGVCKSENGILIYVKRKMTLVSYLQDHTLSYLKFKNGNVIYEVQRFFVNIGGRVKSVYVIKKESLIVEVLSLYEINSPKQFNNMCQDLVIDEIIKEV